MAGAFADDNYYNSGRLMLLLETVVMLIAVKMLTVMMLMRGEVGDCDDADHECDHVDDDYDYNDDGDDYEDGDGVLVVFVSGGGEGDEHASATGKYRDLDRPSKDQSVFDSHPPALVV